MIFFFFYKVVGDTNPSNFVEESKILSRHLLILRADSLRGLGWFLKKQFFEDIFQALSLEENDFRSTFRTLKIAHFDTLLIHLSDWVKRYRHFKVKNMQFSN